MEKNKQQTHEVKHLPTADIIMGGTEEECEQYINGVLPGGDYIIQKTSTPMEQTDRDKALEWWGTLTHVKQGLLANYYFYKTSFHLENDEVECIWREENNIFPPKTSPSPATLEGEQFTPGEWKVALNGESVWADNKNTVCNMANWNSQSKADAKLIAASKDLYYALKELAAEYLIHNPGLEGDTAFLCTTYENALKALQKVNPNYKP